MGDTEVQRYKAFRGAEATGRYLAARWYVPLREVSTCVRYLTFEVVGMVVYYLSDTVNGNRSKPDSGEVVNSGVGLPA